MKNTKKASVSFELKGEVQSKKNMYRISKHGGMFQDPAVLEWMTYCGWQLKQIKPPVFDAPVKLSATFFIKRDKDIDNCLNGLLDCLQYNGVLTNDRIVRRLGDVEKILTKEPKIVVSIEEI
jgi:Holliday junction resolvase RusA-like endonuclease